MFAFATPALLRTRGATAVTPRFSICPALPRAPAPRAAPTMVLYDADTKASTGASSPQPPIRITGNNINLTDALRAYINDKLGKVLRRYVGVVSKMDVHLTVDHNPSIPNRHKAEVVAYSGRTVLRTEVKLDDMYAAIDAAEERIARTVRKFKERRISRSGKVRAADIGDVVADVPEGVDDVVGVGANAQEEVDDTFRDVFHDKIPGVPAVTDVVRRKVFPMPLQTVEEAVLCCEYVDHPWYLFRNAETKEICLVYKRNHGGYGLIEPSNPDIVDGEPV